MTLTEPSLLSRGTRQLSWASRRHMSLYPLFLAQQLNALREDEALAPIGRVDFEETKGFVPYPLQELKLPGRRLVTWCQIVKVCDLLQSRLGGTPSTHIEDNIALLESGYLHHHDPSQDGSTALSVRCCQVHVGCTLCRNPDAFEISVVKLLVGLHSSP